MKYHIFLTSFILLFSINNLKAQSNEEKFGEISEKIETLLRYKVKSSSQLRILLNELDSIKEINKSAFNQLKLRVNNYLLPIEIKLIRSDIYNKKYKIAITKTQDLKANNDFNKSINKLEKYLDRKLYVFHKKNLLNHKPSWFSVEPSLSFYTKEQDIDNFSKVANLNPVYGLGFYFKINNQKKMSSVSRSSFAFSQIGFKVDYRDTNYTLMKDSSNFSVGAYLSPQISFMYRKTLGVDIGMINYTSSYYKDLYSVTTSFYIPMSFLSLGINARLLTDLQSTKPIIQLGASLKFNIGLYKPFSPRDSEEVKSQVIKYKENI